jgi:hypothetical protein
MILNSDLESMSSKDHGPQLSDIQLNLNSDLERGADAQRLEQRGFSET